MLEAEGVQKQDDSSISVEKKDIQEESDKQQGEKFVDGLGFGSLGWGKSKKVVLGEGDTARHYEVYLPGYHNLDDLETSALNPWGTGSEEDEDSLFDLYRLQTQFESYQSLRFQVETLITYGVNHLKREDSERVIRAAIEKALEDLERDDSSVKVLVDQYLLVNGRHYKNAALLNDKEGQLYDVAKTTILELVENADRDILDEVESGVLSLEYGSFGDDEEEELATSVDLSQLRVTLDVLIQKKIDHIWKMDEQKSHI